MTDAKTGEAFFLQIRATMTNQRPILVTACLALLLGACRSAPTPMEVPTPPPHRSTPMDEMTMSAADSEVFNAVLRVQQAAGTDAYPLHIDGVHYDSRPYGSGTGYPDFPAGIQGAAPELSFGKAHPAAISRIAQARRRILRANGIAEGPPPVYTQCAGMSVPTPPPPRRRTTTKPRDVHAGCPKRAETYITVGLPVRGEPIGLTRIRDTRGDLVNIDGDVWMAQVDEHFAGPSGWRISQYAWLFRRDGDRGRLELVSTIPIAVID